MSLITILIALLIFGVIVLIHEFGHFTVAKRAGVTVHEFSIGMGPALLKRERSGTLYALRLLPIGGFVSMEGENDMEEEGESDDPNAFSKKSLAKRVAILFAGAFNNLLLGYVLLLILTVMNGWVGTTQIIRLEEGTSAYGILEVGDTITAVNGHRVYTSNDVSYEFLRDEDGLVEMTVRRGNETLTRAIQFPLETVEGQQFITIDFRVAAVRPTALQYFTYPVNWSLSIVKEIWGTLLGLLTGRYAINQLSGPVGVVSAIGQASRIGFRSLLTLAAYITINIGIFNLLPIPILDGGRIVLEIAGEILPKNRWTRGAIGALMAASVALMILLMIFVTVQDITRVIS